MEILKVLPIVTEHYSIKTKIMKKLFTLLFLVFSALVFSQQYYSGNYASMPRLDDADNFYYIEWELNPADFPNRLSDIETLKKQNQQPNIQYNITKNGASADVEQLINGQLYSKSSYKNGVLDGNKSIYFENGNLFQEFNFKNGKANGVSNIYDEKYHLILSTTYKDNVKNGIRKFTNPRRDEMTIEGNYVNGKLVGDLKIYSNGTNTSLYTYPNDLKKGKVKRFHNDKLLAEFTIYDENKITGDVKTYNPETGKLIKKTPYLFGQINGFEEIYNLQGELVSKAEYKFGNKIGEHKTYSNDKKLLKEEYYDDNGLKTGTWKEYGKNGEVYTEQEYKNDKLNGFSKRYSQGLLQETSKYKDNKRNGLAKFYKSGTTLVTSDVYYLNDYFYKEIVYYDNGKVFSLREIDPKTKTTTAKYYNPDGTFYHENITLENNINVGLNKSIEKVDNALVVRTETWYDGKKNRVKQISYGYKRDGSYTEYNFRNNTFHGESKSFNPTTGETKIIYYYETKNKYKIVTKEEFEKLTADEKK